MAKQPKPVPPRTPEDIIRQRRRDLANRADILGFLGRLALLCLLLVLLFGVVFGIMPMPDDEMAPRLSAGDLLFYYRMPDDWASGDVLVVCQQGHRYVARVVARGGDTVEITEDATLKVNGNTVLESEIYTTTPRYDSGVTYPLTLADDELFLLCDAREGARDSRWYGPVKTREVVGKVITVIRRSGL